jgi:2-methylfumaryl-CoA isomerase
MFASIEQPDVGRTLVPGLPLDFSALSRTPARPAPRLGQHTEEVLSELLGLGSAELGRLFEKRVIARPASEGL